MPAAVRKEEKHGLKKPAGKGAEEKWDEARRRLLSPDDKLSDVVRKAVSREKDLRRKADSKMRGIRRRVEMLENRDGLDDTLSRSLDDTVASEDELGRLWTKMAESKQGRDVKAELDEWSKKATNDNRRGYEAAKSFYRGTSVDEALDVVNRGGGISADGEFEFTSLSTSLGVANSFGRKKPAEHVILEYDGDSIRETGTAVPAKYSHTYTDTVQTTGGGMPLFDRLEKETRIPDGTKGPVLKRVWINADRVFTTGFMEKIKKLEDAGIEVSTFLL